MRRFQLYRAVDSTGISGTGTVAEGVQFTDGKVVIRWLSSIAQTAIWEDIEDVREIHGHNGNTSIIWLD